MTKGNSAEREQLNAIDHAQKILRAVKRYDLAALLADGCKGEAVVALHVKKNGTSFVHAFQTLKYGTLPEGVHNLYAVPKASEGEILGHALYAALCDECDESEVAPQAECGKSRVLDLRMLGYELEGVLIDVANGGFDKVCLETVRRVRNELGAAPQAECAPLSAMDILVNVRAHGGDLDAAIGLLAARNTQAECAPRASEGGQFLAWFNREYPMDETGSRVKYKETCVMDLMRAAFAAGTSERADAEKDAALNTLFDILMLQNIVTGEESYLSLRCVGVPPDQEEFVQAVKRAILAADKEKP